MVCNSGVRVTPTIDGSVHTFEEQGLYDGLFLMLDLETRTYWDHLTGDALYGPLVGTTLPIANLRQTTVEQVLAEDPDALVALSDRTLRRDDDLRYDGLMARVRGRLSRLFQGTVADEDTRRPQMDLGMGIWAGDESRYYPMETIQRNGRFVLDTFQGRRVLVFLEPVSVSLNAVYVDAERAEWDGRTLRLSNGMYVENGVFHDAAGARVRMERPMQVYTRWYGFSQTFRDPVIYGEGG
ncbi:MAG: DUF3179 domain-containing (seleno)protein [Longimicrobiales bacterium]|nr:DUF3179 domain-containing (seleno)protein [Longimicrobiales bacterium]